MSLLNTITAVKFLKDLTTPFNKMKAYELGIIDEDGKLLKKKRDRKTTEEKQAYDTFTKLIVNIKRHLAMVPFLRGRLGSLAAALWLMRESNELELTDDEMMGTFTQYLREERIMNEEYIKDLIEEYYSTYLLTEQTTTGSSSSAAGFSGDAESPVAGYDKGLKKKKRRKVNGVDIFEVDSDTLKSAKLGRRNRDSFIKTLENKELAKELRKYFKTYPSDPLILQDASGVMIKLRR